MGGGKFQTSNSKFQRSSKDQAPRDPKNAKRICGITYAIRNLVRLDQLIAKLQKLSLQVEKGMSRQGFTVWTGMIREDLYKISNAEVRKGALKMLGVVECAGFCLDRAPEARETLILPNLKPLIDYLKDGGKKPVLVNAAAEVDSAVVQMIATDEGEDGGFNPS